MKVFNMMSSQVTSEKLVKDIDYKEVMDGNNVAHHFINFENPKFCKREGIIEFIPMR